MIRRGLFAKYAEIYDHSIYSPIKASVDVWRYTNASKKATLGNMEHRLEELANELWDEYFGEGRHYVPSSAYSLDTEPATTALNIHYRYHVYIIDLNAGNMETLAMGIKKW